MDEDLDFGWMEAPADSLEARENQMIVAAYDLAEVRLKSGTASAQETVHFLKMGSTRERLDQEKVRHENELLRARVEEMRSRANAERKYDEILKAFRSYQGADIDEEDEEFYEDSYYH